MTTSTSTAISSIDELRAFLVTTCREKMNIEIVGELS